MLDSVISKQENYTACCLSVWSNKGNISQFHPMVLQYSALKNLSTGEEADIWNKVFKEFKRIFQIRIIFIEIKTYHTRAMPT